jgi:hypothetical protein
MTRLMIAMVMAGALLAGSGLPGCASKGGGYAQPEVSDRVASDDMAERERQLRALVQRRKVTEAHAREQNQETVKRRAPYFFKEYSSYPDGEVDIEFSATESRSAPLLASVTLPKVRYATRLHRERNAALRDTTFIRATGYERQEYALRNGRWVSLGDTFVAERSEVQVNGQWLPVKEETETVAAPEESGGWFSRTWKNLTGS